jgi:hypothetical protein
MLSRLLGAVRHQRDIPPARTPAWSSPRGDGALALRQWVAEGAGLDVVWLDDVGEGRLGDGEGWLGAGEGVAVGEAVGPGEGVSVLGGEAEVLALAAPGPADEAATAIMNPATSATTPTMTPAASNSTVQVEAG